MMDTGSQRSYVTENVRNQLTLSTVGKQCMTIATFGATKRDERVCASVRVGLRVKYGQVKVFTLFSVPRICDPLTPHPLADTKEMYPHLSGLELADDPGDAQELQVDILIGSDYYWQFITGQLQRGTSGPVAIQTCLGWVLSGPVSTPGHVNAPHNLMTHSLQITLQVPEAQQPLEEIMKSFWELESFGIPATDRSLYDEFCNTTRFHEGRYEVQLPWKAPQQELPNNYALSLKRLTGLLHRLRHNPDVLHEYDAVIKGQLAQGIVERVEGPPDIPGVYYLPHHAVIRRGKATTKLRVVYDASAQTTGPSLNECLNPGPKFDQKILDILTRFRVHRVAVTADVEKAFLMISVAAKDREFLRFLWIDDPVQEEPRVVVYRSARVVFGVTASPFLLNATIRHHLELHAKTHGDLVSKVLRSMYVDDLVTGAESDKQAYELYMGAKRLLRSGAFNLRKFSTNSSCLQAKVDGEEASPSSDLAESTPTETFSQATLGNSQGVHDGEQKVLGVNWSVSSDQFIFSFAELAEQAQGVEPTKRSIISLIGRIYDPLGFLAPIVVSFKVFMQSLCEARIGWDETIPESMSTRWYKLVAALQESQPLAIPRCYLEGVEGDVLSYRLCGFCDASLSAYAAVIYLSIESEDESRMRFIVAKTRVAPLKKQSVPRLELLSAVLLARLMDTVRSSLSTELEFSSCHCFTDSRVALCWIRNVEKAWKPFVQNRVAEIRSLLPVESWRHIPGDQNPADVASRGTTPLELLVDKLWRDRPKLSLDHSVPLEQSDLDVPLECLEELRAREKRAVHGLLASETAKPGIGSLIKVQDFSDLNRLISILTQVLKFRSKLREKAGFMSFSGMERQYAELLLIKDAQESLKCHKNFTTWKRQFSFFEDDGVLRCQGRIDNAQSLPYSAKHPIILPSNSHLTTLYVRRAHARVLHNGVKETLTELRSQFWVIRGRSVVKRILHNCYTCRRYEGRACRVPQPPRCLPSEYKKHLHLPTLVLTLPARCISEIWVRSSQRHG